MLRVNLSVTHGDLMSIQFEKGVFQEFRATTPIHIGELEITIGEDDVIEFDGFTMKYSGHELKKPNLRGVIRSLNWFVPASDHTTSYRPQPSGAVIHSATPNRDGSRDQINMGVVEDDSKVVAAAVKPSPRRVTGTSGDQIKRTFSKPAKLEVTAQNASSLSREIEAESAKAVRQQQKVAWVGNPQADVAQSITVPSGNSSVAQNPAPSVAIDPAEWAEFQEFKRFQAMKRQSQPPVQNSQHQFARAGADVSDILDVADGKTPVV